MKLEFSADIQAADSESRILAGQIVPFGVVGNTSAGKVIFAEGSFVELDPKNIKLLLEHDSKKPIGKAMEFAVTEKGIEGKFKIAKTTRGTDTIVEAEAGLRTGFSVGASVLEYETDKRGVMTVTAAELLEVSVVSRAAFGDDAQITEVAATSPEVVEETDEKETTVEKETTEDVVVEESAPAVEASVPTAPIYTRPRVKPLTEGEAFAHAVYAASGREDSRRLLVEAADDTSNNTGFTLSRGLPVFISDTFDSRPAIDAVGINALPASGLSYTLPRLTQAPVVDEIAELDPITNTDTESDYITIDVKKIAGRNVVSFELMDRSDPSFGEIMLRELRRAYALKSDTYLLDELVAGGTWSGGFSGDWQGLQAFVANQVPAVYKTTGGLIANQLVANADWWAELIGAVDNSDRPVFNAVAPSNASGNVGVSAPSGSVFGTNFRVDQNIAASGLIDASAFLVARDAVWYAESPQTQLRTNILSDGSVEVELYGYVAAKVLKANGVRKFNLT